MRQRKEIKMKHNKKEELEFKTPSVEQPNSREVAKSETCAVLESFFFGICEENMENPGE